MQRFILLIVFVLINFGVFSVYSKPIYQGKVNAKFAKVYKSADINSIVLRTLTKGVLVSIIDEKGIFFQIEVNSNKGWAIKEEIDLINNDLEPLNETEPIDTQPVNESNNTEDVIIEQRNPNLIYNKINYGINTGLSFSKITGDYFSSSNSNFRIGFSIGAFAYYRFTEFLGFMAEINYINRGGKGKNDDGEDITLKFDYLEFPLLFRIDFDLTNNPFVYSGLSLNYIINKALITNDNTYIVDDLKKIDLGFIVGGGYKFNLYTNVFHFDLRYFRSFSSIHDAATQIDIKNNSIEFKIGIDL